MTVSANSSLTAAIGTGSTTVARQITGVPAGATLVAAILNRSNETNVVSAISDDVNGSWTLAYVAGPVDSAGSTYRAWLAYRNNVGAGDTTITVTFDAAINSQLAVGYLSSDLGALSFEGAATTRNAASNETNVDSNTFASSGAGALVGFLGCNNSQADPEPTADGASESRITSGQGGGRAFLFFEPHASAGTYGLETTCDSATTVFIVGSFLEPADAGATAAPSQATLTAEGRTPALLTERAIAPSTGALSLGGLASTLERELTQSVGVGAVSLGGQSPGVGGGVGPEVGGCSLLGLAPSLYLERAITPTTGLVTISGQIPSFEQPTLAPDCAGLNYQGLEPTLQTEWLAQPEVGIVTLQGYAPGGDASADRGHIGTGRRWHGRAYRYEPATESYAVAVSDAFPKEAEPAAEPIKKLGGLPTFKPLEKIPVGVETKPDESWRAESEARIAAKKKRRKDEEALIFKLINQRRAEERALLKKLLTLR